jgi:hypothetical protein
MAAKPKPTQETALGHEIPVPKRRDFLRDLKRVSKDADADELLKQPSKRKPKQPS